MIFFLIIIFFRTSDLNEMNASNLSSEFPPLSPGGYSTALIVFLTLQQCVFVLSFSGNLVVIIVVLKYLKLNTFSNQMVVSLAVTDLCTGFSSGSQLLYILFPVMDQNKVSCFLRFRIVVTMTIASQLSLVFSTLDRLVAIHYPHKYSGIMTKSLGIFFIILAWSFALITGLLPFFTQDNWNDIQFCFYQIVFDKYLYLFDSFTTVSFMMTSFFMNLAILKTAWSFLNRVRPAFETSRNRQKRIKMKSDVNSAKVWGLVTLFNSICWAPFTAFNIKIGLGVAYTMPEIIVMNWLVFLGMLNSIMNPFIFAWHRQDFNKSLKRLFKIQQRRVEPVVGIQVITLRKSNTASYSANNDRASSSHTTKT